ncbi:MAG: glycine cleavage system protein H [Victivallales bacterium]|nr:glycine cleavage system protein H [Victivallales bacterium]
MENGSNRKYSDGHLWVDVQGDQAVVGLTGLALEELGNVTFVELPERGASIIRDDALFVLEAEKASGDFVAPIDCIVTDCNDILAKDTTLVNSSPEGKGWICKVKITDKSQLADLMDAEEYLSEFGKHSDGK